jgi:hypothetical protein
LSQTGQSSGWLISRSSITPCCALSAASEVYCVHHHVQCTGCGAGRHRLALPLPPRRGTACRPYRVRGGCRGPRDLDADQLGRPITSVPLGTLIHVVDGQVDHLDRCGGGAGVSEVFASSRHPLLRWPSGSRRADRTDSRRRGVRRTRLGRT